MWMEKPYSSMAHTIVSIYQCRPTSGSYTASPTSRSLLSRRGLGLSFSLSTLQHSYTLDICRLDTVCCAGRLSRYLNSLPVHSYGNIRNHMTVPP